MQQLVLHRAAVDEEILLGGIGAVQVGSPAKPETRTRLARAGDGKRVAHELAAHDATEPLQQPMRAVSLVRIAASPVRSPVVSVKPTSRMRHGKALHDLGDGLVLGALGLQELEPRGHAARTGRAPR